MEPVGSISEAEWSSLSLSGMYNTTEEADFMVQLLANHPLPTTFHSHSWPHDHDQPPLNMPSGSYSSGMANHPNPLYFSQGSSYDGASSSSFCPTPPSSNGDCFLNDFHPIALSKRNSIPMDFFDGDGKSNDSYPVEGDECLHHETRGCNIDQEPEFPDWNSQDEKIPEIRVPEQNEDDRHVSGNKKRSSFPNKSKRNVRSRKNQKDVSPTGNEDENNANGRTASTCCSENDSNNSQERRAGVSPSVSSEECAALNTNGKSRASRGTATDPQSLYARKRRERINERLRILQSLVPNGTKVDISTMLEEAVQYVKFLQLQIKLLSSDDLWIYAPLAYNGMSIGFDLNIPTPPKGPKKI